MRTAWEVVLADNGAEPVAFTTYVDAQTNTVLLREDLVDYQQEDPDPFWAVFPNSPPLDYSSVDTRVIAGVGRSPAPSAIACWRRLRRRRSRGTRTR